MKSLLCLFVLVSGLALGQNLDPASLSKPATDSWPTYSGDYSGRRYSTLKQIDQSNVKNLGLAWAARITAGTRGAAGAPPTIVGGVGDAESVQVAAVRGSILQVDGVLFMTTPDNAWAIDARDGHEIWHFFWKTRGGIRIGNRGVGMWKNRIYMETPDDFLVALDAKTGKEIWHKEIASFDLQYYSSCAPILIGNHLIVGTGNDLDEPGVLESFDPDTGEIQWRFYPVPTKKGDPGLETWSNLDAASHGGGNMWIPGSYDPETHLYIVGTGNPTAAYTSQRRGPGANLYTCSQVAINVETGKMAWYYQVSPHDTHDFDASETPILVDGTFHGKPRKMVMTLARNGYFFVLDRTTGEHLLTSKISQSVNWAGGLDEQGHPVRIPEKDFDVAGALVSPSNQGTTNWQPASYNPETKLYYAQTIDSYSMYYLATLDPRGAMGMGGKDELNLGSTGTYLTAINYETGKIAWQHRYPGLTNNQIGNGILNTAGRLLFAGDSAGNFIAYDPANGSILWHSRIPVSNAPETYMLDGKQYITVAAGDTIYSYRLN